MSAISSDQPSAALLAAGTRRDAGSVPLGVKRTGASPSDTLSRSAASTAETPAAQSRATLDAPPVADDEAEYDRSYEGSDTSDSSSVASSSKRSLHSDGTVDVRAASLEVALVMKLEYRSLSPELLGVVPGVSLCER